MGRKKKRYTYTLYYGDDFIDLGSRKYIADLLGVKEKTVEWYTFPAWRKRHKDENEGIIIIKFE